MAEAFCKEACEALGIGVTKLTPMTGILEKCMSGSPTPLRFDMYSRCWLASRGLDIISAGPFLKEAMDWAMALCALKGICLPLFQGVNPLTFFSGVVEKLRTDFGYVGEMREIVPMRGEGLSFWKFHLCAQDTDRIYNKFYKRAVVSSVMPVSDSLKGTYENPYENVYEAMDFIRAMEAAAWKNDSLLREISQQKYFYDCEQGHFRITWASPYVAHYRNDYPKHSFIFNQMNTRFFSLKPNLYGQKFIYRGQSDCFPGKPCVPNLFRDPKHNDEGYYLDFLIYSQEMECLIASHPLVKYLESGVDLLHDKFPFRTNYLGLAQHYYNKSSMLDFSSDLDVAQFFAVTEYDREADNYYPCHDKGKIGVIYCYELQFPGAFGEHKGYALKTIGKQLFMRSGNQSGLLLEMAKGVDLKKIPEVQKIYFKQVPDISDRIFEKSGRGSLYFGEDLLQHAWYDRFKQRAKDGVVSMAAVDLNYSNNKDKETKDRIISNLAKRNISIDNYIPCFSEEELDMFRKDVRDGWWDDFCSDIHFYGPEDELYRDALRHLDIQTIINH